MNDLKDTPEETDSKTAIVCPWCFHSHVALFFSEWPRTCQQCGKRFLVRVTKTYHAKPVMEDKPKEDLSGVNSPLNWKWNNPEDSK